MQEGALPAAPVCKKELVEGDKDEGRGVALLTTDCVPHGLHCKHAVFVATHQETAAWGVREAATLVTTDRMSYGLYCNTMSTLERLPCMGDIAA